MKKLVKILIFLFSMIPFVSKAQFIQYLGTKDNIVETRNILRVDSAFELPITDTSKHPTRPGRLISFNGEPWWWDGAKWFQLNGDTTTVPGQVNADWNSVSGVSKILNKPVLAAVATSGSYLDLSNQPTIPAAQVNSDWNAVSGISQILNKPNFVDSIWRTVGKDSIQFTIRGRYHSILDSAGVSGGSGTVTLVTVNSLNPLFTSNTTNQTSTPTTSFTLQTAGAFNIFGNNTGSTTIPAYFAPTSTIINTWFGGSGVQPLVVASNTVNQYYDGFKQFVTFNTDSISEGATNKYFTATRVYSSLTPDAPILFNGSTGHIGIDTSAGLTHISTQAYSNTHGPVTSVSNSDGTLTISPTAGAVVASVNTAHGFSWSGTQTFSAVTVSGAFKLTGVTSGGSNDSIMTINPSTGVVGYVSRFTSVGAVNGVQIIGITGDSLGIGGNLIQNTLIGFNGFTFGFSGMLHKTAISTDSMVIRDASNNLWVTAIPAGGGGGSSGGIGIDSVQTISSGSTATQTTGFNIVQINPTSLLSSMTLTTATTFHTSNDLYIVFGGSITSGNTVVGTFNITAGAGLTLVQSVNPNGMSYVSGEVIHYRKVGSFLYRIN